MNHAPSALRRKTMPTTCLLTFKSVKLSAYKAIRTVKLFTHGVLSHLSYENTLWLILGVIMINFDT